MKIISPRLLCTFSSVKSSPPKLQQPFQNTAAMHLPLLADCMALLHFLTLYWCRIIRGAEFLERYTVIRQAEVSPYNQ